MKNHKSRESQKDTRHEIIKIRIIIAILIPAVIATIGVCAFVMHINMNETVTPLVDGNDEISLHNDDETEDSTDNKEAIEGTPENIPMEKEMGAVLQETEDVGEEYIMDTLFLGDSNTVRMMDYGFTSEDKTFAVLGMGIQSVKSLPCVQLDGTKDPITMIDAVRFLQPERIIITFGTNNANGMTTKEFIDNYEEALTAIKKVSPKTVILINSIPPIREKNSYPGLYQQKIDRFNKALIGMADKEGYKFIDSESVLKDENTGYAKDEYTVEDGIHYSEEGLEAMFHYIRTHSYENKDVK